MAPAVARRNGCPRRRGRPGDRAERAGAGASDRHALPFADGGIELEPAGQSAIVLTPSADGTLYNADVGVRIRVEVPETGPVTSITLEQRQLKLIYTR
jgi:hypothetical protein